MKMKKPNHIGIVVNDIEKAKKEYTELLGINKWYQLIHTTKQHIFYKGEEKDCDITIYMGSKGFTKLELIQTRGGRNIYTDFLENHGEGLHHIMYNVKNLKKAIAEFETHGYKVLQSGSFWSAKTFLDYAYMGKNETDVIFEICESTMYGKIKKSDIPFEQQIGTLLGNFKRVK